MVFVMCFLELFLDMNFLLTCLFSVLLFMGHFLFIDLFILCLLLWVPLV